jgi:hypothetical protein
MHICFQMTRLASLIAGALMITASFAAAQGPAEPDKPVTPPDSYRVVMENDRVRIIEIHIKAHSKVDVDSPANRERFLYMLSDGALILAPPGKTPYEFALHAGETAVFPAVSPTVGNDTNSAVRALMVEIKEPSRAVATGKVKGRQIARRGAQGRFAARSGKSGGKSAGRSASRSKAMKSASVKSKARQAAKPSRPQSAATRSVRPPLNLSKANSKPTRKVTGKKGRGSDS